MTTQCLIVDDSPTVRRVIRQILAKMQFEISEAEDGEQALSYCIQQQPDLVLLDWNMPVMDGLTFLQLLRQEQSIKQPIVIFCTTVNEMSHIAKALEVGANEYVMKPFDEEIIKTKLEQVGIL